MSLRLTYFEAYDFLSNNWSLDTDPIYDPTLNNGFLIDR